MLLNKHDKRYDGFETVTVKDLDKLDMYHLKPLEAESETSLRHHDLQHPETTRKELWGWYLFEFGAQPFSSAALTVFIPLILEDLAWNAATSDPHNPHYPPCQSRSATLLSGDPPCFIQFGALMVKPVSYTLYITAISVAFQVFAFLSLGALADFSTYRKKLLLLFSFLNSVFCIGFVGVLVPPWYNTAAVLSILANVCFGCSLVFYNAYLPLLIKSHPDLLSNVVSNSESSKELSEKILETRERVGNEISTNGFAAGYVGSVLCLLGFMAVLWATGASTYIMQCCVAACGLLQLVVVFTTTARWLKPRPGPPLPATTSGFNLLLFSWRKTYETLQQCKKLRHTFLYLLSWFFYSDAYSTIATVAVLYGKSELRMTNTQLMIIAVVTPFLAMAGNYVVLYAGKKLGWSSKTIVVALICFMCVVPIWGLLGFILPETWKIGGIRTISEMYTLAFIYGFLLGPLQSYSRSLYSELIPLGMESEFFALYEVTDRGSSWIGPLLVGLCTDVFGDVRYGFVALILMFVGGLGLLCAMDQGKGKQHARAFKL